MSLMTIVLLGLAGMASAVCPGAWLTRHATSSDIRHVGSNSTGAANVWHAVGFRTFIAVALLDIGKGSAAADLGLAIGGRSGAVVAGAGALLGHWRPVCLGLRRGGKVNNYHCGGRPGDGAAGIRDDGHPVVGSAPRGVIHLSRLHHPGAGARPRQPPLTRAGRAPRALAMGSRLRLCGTH